MSYSPAQVRKSLIAAVGFVLTVLSVALDAGGVIPDAALPYVTVALAVGSTYGVFKAPNAPAGKHEAV